VDKRFLEKQDVEVLGESEKFIALPTLLQAPGVPRPDSKAHWADGPSPDLYNGSTTLQFTRIWAQERD
jgi:hypothetical protein